jgi:hypothetical protein
MSLNKLFLCILLTLVAASLHADPSETKNITIFNNTDKTIYPIVQVTQKPEGAPNVWIYSLYLNISDQVVGVPANQSISIQVPQEQDGISWWNAARVYVYNQTPPAPNPKVQGSVSGFPVHVDEQGTGLPLDDPYQFAEYTFDNSGGNYVGYDVSYVDSVYLPLAIEVEDGSVGYSGTDKNLSEFQSIIADFVKNQQWPYFFLSNETPYYSIPGGFNLFALDQARSSHDSSKFMLQGDRVAQEGSTVGLENVVARWKKAMSPDFCSDCETQSPFCNAFQKNATDVWNAFKEDGGSTTDEAITGRILGFTDAFGPTLSQQDISLEEGITTDPSGGTKYPDYTSKYNLNPYVRLIHHDLNANVYAFSIDDAVGFVRVPGTGITITVGGLKGLKNQTPYVNPASLKENNAEPIIGDNGTSGFSSILINTGEICIGAVQSTNNYNETYVNWSCSNCVAISSNIIHTNFGNIGTDWDSRNCLTVTNSTIHTNFPIDFGITGSNYAPIGATITIR